jgi:NAD(P)H-dependent FMN reductase
MKGLRIALLLGSVSEGRFCDTVAGWLTAALARHEDLAVDVLDPVAVLPGLRSGAGEADFRARVAAADGFVMVTPEYNHGYPAALKEMIDAARVEWRAKPVGFVSYGGAGGGLRAVEQLRQVVAELHAVGLRDCVSFADAWERFDDAGRLRRPEQAERALGTMLAELRWWAAALARARAVAPPAPVGQGAAS